MALLDVIGLTVDLATSRGTARAVRGVDFRLGHGQTLGIVGESGCGKSITALALMGLLPEGARSGGRVALEGRDLLALSDREMQQIRGRRLAMIFQEPMTSLNPVHRVGRQIAEAVALHRGLKGAALRHRVLSLLDHVGPEAVALHRGLKGAALRHRVLSLLDHVGLPEPEQQADAYPHELSGGQRQRAMIAMALSCEPDVLIADEPTTALDVTIQGQILELINSLVDEHRMALIMISHDLGVIAETCDEIMIMYGGMVVERGPTAELFAGLAHPYSVGLMAAVPQPGRGRGQRLATIQGVVPDLMDLPPGCPFADRCELADRHCADAKPRPHVRTGSGPHEVACHKLPHGWREAT